MESDLLIGLLCIHVVPHTVTGHHPMGFPLPNLLLIFELIQSDDLSPRPMVLNSPGSLDGAAGALGPPVQLETSSQ